MSKDPEVIEGEVVEGAGAPVLDAKFTFEHNPRKISNQERRELERSLKKLGDLSGVVFCRKHQAFVGGNQRGDIMDGCEIEYVETLETPNEQRTVARGFITFQGEKFAYREVEFSDEEFDEACIGANARGGNWDFQKLADKWASKPIKKYGLTEGPEALLKAGASRAKDVSFTATEDVDKDYYVKVKCANELEASGLVENLSTAGFTDIQIKHK